MAVNVALASAGLQVRPAAGVLAWAAVGAEPVHGAQEEKDHHREDRREGGEVLVLREKE